jgi:hypothetical protein
MLNGGNHCVTLVKADGKLPGAPNQPLSSAPDICLAQQLRSKTCQGICQCRAIVWDG